MKVAQNLEFTTIWRGGVQKISERIELRGAGRSRSTAVFEPGAADLGFRAQTSGYKIQEFQD